MRHPVSAALKEFRALRRASQRERRAAPITFIAIAVLVTLGGSFLVLVRRTDPALARTMPFWVLTLAAIAAAVVYEFCNPLPDVGHDERLRASGDVDPQPLIAMAERILKRRRADYADVGNNLATLLGFVATGTGIVVATSTGKAALPTPLIVVAGASLLAVVLLCLLGLRPQHRDDGPATNIVKAFGGWLHDAEVRKATRIDHGYVEYVLQSCDRYERSRRVRRSYYIYAGWCLALALVAIGVNAVVPDCALTPPGAAAACASAKK